MWLFEILLRLYPAGFRAEYGDAMRLAAREELAESGWLWFAARTGRDFLLGWPPVVGAELMQDLRYCWRSWRKRTLVTALAVLSLGMALGISIGVFSVMNAMLYRALPFREPERLVQFEAYFAPVFAGREKRLEWEREHSFIGEFGQYSSGEFGLEREGGSVRIKGAETRASFFRMMGAPLWLGRDFSPEEEQVGKGGVVILSHALYQQAFGGDARILGQTIRLNRQPLVVIGVAAPGFDYPNNATVWMPTVFDFGRIPKEGVSSTITIGRLADGLSLTQAQAAFEAVQARKKPQSTPGGVDFTKPRITPLKEVLVGPTGQAVWVLFGGVCAVLLIACANLSHLLFSRFSERAEEFRIRGWLGAGQSRIAQQILTECLTLAMVSGAVGLLFAEGTARIGAHYFPPLFAFQKYEVLDVKVLGFAFVATMACGLGFGLGPLWFRGEGMARRANRVRHGLLCGQMCLTAVLLVSAISMGHGLLDLYRMDLGYETAGIETATVSLAGSVYESPARRQEFLERSLAAAREVGRAGAIDFLPLAANTFMAGLYQVQSKRDPEMAVLLRMSPGFLEAVGARLLAGRDFTERDAERGEPVVIVNETFAKLNGGVREMLGRKLRLSDDNRNKEPAPTVVGVVRDFRFAGPVDSTMATVMRPLAQSPSSYFTIAARSRAPLGTVLSAVDAKVPVYDVMPFAKRLERAMARPNFFTLVLLFFGGFSTLLTMIHGYSLCANTLEQRKREMGIRTALGATTGQLRWMVLRQMLPALAAGLATGFLLSTYAAGWLSILMEGAKEAPAPLRLLAVGTLALTALLSIWWKTRGILRMRPADTLRGD